MPFGIGKSRPQRSRSTRSSRSGATRASIKKQGTVVGTFVLAFIRLCQLVAAIVLLGYYGAQLGKSHDNKATKYNGTSFTYAVVVATLAAITALFFMVISFFGHFFAVALLFVWEWCLVILWAAVTGVMGNKYFHSKPAGSHDWKSMKIAAGFSCASLILWFITAVAGTVGFFVGGRNSGMGSGRSRV